MKIRNLRYVIAGMLFVATAINYADRQMIAVVSTELRQEFNLDEVDYGEIVAWFMFGYAIMYAGSGPIADRLGTRRGYIFFVSAWSAAAMGHAFSFGKGSLIFWRFMLSLAQPGNWAVAAKGVAEWFPANQRALGVGIFNSGSAMGLVLGPPLVAFLTLEIGWRAAFLITGSLGFVWLLGWLALYRAPHESKLITGEELAFLEGKVTPPDQTAPARPGLWDWLRVLGKRECYALVVARFFTDPVVYFIMFWLPEYLRAERGFDLEMVGKYSWVPFFVGSVGYIVGGWLNGYLMRQGWPLAKARRLVLFLGAIGMPAAIFAPRVEEAWMAIGFTCVVTFGHALWISSLLTLPTDIFPGPQVGTSTGLTGMGGAVGGILANLVTGHIVRSFSYTPVFLMAGLMHPLSFGLLWLLLPNNRIRRIDSAQAA